MNRILQEGPTLRATWRMVRRRIRIIGGTALAFAVAGAVLSMVMPRVFQARCSLLPPVQSSVTMPGMAGMEAPLGILGFQDQSVATAKLFQQILRSRTVLEDVIRDQGLLEWYRLRERSPRAAMEEAVNDLRADTDVSTTTEGMIEVRARAATSWFAGRAREEEARQKAAEVANALVEQLDKVNREKSLSRAKQTRLYLERQLADNNGSIQQLSRDLAQFQRRHGAIALDAQTKALVENASELKSRLLAKEVELGLAMQTMTAANPALSRLREESNQLRLKLSSLEGNDRDSIGTSDDWAGLPASEIPDLGYQLARYQRELQAQLLLQSYLNQQYYQAKVQEASDAPTIQVLDPAVPPVGRLSPKRRLMVGAGVIAGIMVGLLAASWRETNAPSPLRDRVAGS